MKYLKRIKISYLALFIILLVLAFLWLVPVIWMLSTAFRPEEESIGIVFHWLPQKFTLENFKGLFEDTSDVQIMRWALNSTFIAVVHTVLKLTIDSLAAFAFARLTFRFKETIFWFLMSTMMIPGVINLIPVYILVDKFHWIDTPWAMIIPGLGGVFGVFLLRQFFEGLPTELDEAARIDGAGLFRIYIKIIMPLAKPALTALAIFTFMGNWNDFLWPLIVTNDASQRTLPAGLSIFQGEYMIYKGKLMAGAAFSAILPLVFFLFGQKYFVKGITLGGVKE